MSGQFGNGFDPRRGRGKPGRSGRPSTAFREWCRQLFEEQTLNPSSWPEGRRTLWERAAKSDRIVLDLLARAYGPSGVPAYDDGGGRRIVVTYTNNWRTAENGQVAADGGQLTERTMRPITSLVDEYPDGRKETRSVARVIAERVLPSKGQE